MTAQTQTQSTAQKPVLLEAINLTSRTLEDRLWLYRNLVVVVSVVSVASLLTALVWWRPWPLTGLILLVPLTGGFLFLDSRRVLRWRREILWMRETRALDLAAFVNTISLFKHLPASSLQGMLGTLRNTEAIPPTNSHGTASPPCTQDLSNWSANWKILAGTIALTLALTGLAAGLYWRSWWPVLGTVVCAISFVFLKRA